MSSLFGLYICFQNLFAILTSSVQYFCVWRLCLVPGLAPKWPSNTRTYVVNCSTNGVLITLSFDCISILTPCRLYNCVNSYIKTNKKIPASVQIAIKKYM